MHVTEKSFIILPTWLSHSPAILLFNSLLVQSEIAATVSTFLVDRDVNVLTLEWIFGCFLDLLELLLVLLQLLRRFNSAAFIAHLEFGQTILFFHRYRVLTYHFLHLLPVILHESPVSEELETILGMENDIFDVQMN